MSVHIRLIKNNIKRSSSFGKYFAKTVSQGEVTLNEIAAEACRNSGFSEGSVIGVTTELQEILKHRLREGQTVHKRDGSFCAHSAIISQIASKIGRFG